MPVWITGEQAIVPPPISRYKLAGCAIVVKAVEHVELTPAAALD